MGPEYEATLRRARTWVATNEAIGEPIDAFRERAHGQGFRVRVLPEPGGHVLVTADRRANRINVRLADGHIIAVDGVY